MYHSKHFTNGEATRDELVKVRLWTIFTINTSMSVS